MSLSVPGRRLLGDDEAFEAIKEGNRQKYIKIWKDFKIFLGDFDLEKSIPSEDDVLRWIRKMRTEDKFMSSSLWTKYSMVNTVIKAKYGFSMKDYHRVTNLLKSYDVDIKKKAAVFSKEELDRFVGDVYLGTPYWCVRKAVVITTYFGGLRKTELESLELEKIVSTPLGIEVTHARAKQRSDCKETKFLIPRSGEQPNYAEIVEGYFYSVRNVLGKSTGRCWYTGRNNVFINAPMGKNYLGKIPLEMAQRLELENPSQYTFHSYRRSAATVAADAGASPEQLKQHFGWKSSEMASHYITTSKKAITDVASKLAGVGELQRKEGEQRKVMEQRKVKEEREESSESGWIIPAREEEEDPFVDDSVDKEMVQIADMAEKKGNVTFGFPTATKVFIIQGGTNTFH